MVTLFIDCDGDIGSASKQIFGALSLAHYLEGDSLHVLGGTYYALSIFGIRIKLEENDYGYDDEYSYVITVYRDPCGLQAVDDSMVTALSRIVIRTLSDNANMGIVIEKDRGIEVVRSR